MLLIDECISIHFKFKAKPKQKVVRTIRVLGAGISDSIIADYAEKHNAHIVTGDIKFASNQVMKCKRPVFFVTMHNGELYHINIKKIGKIKSRYGKITHYIRRCRPRQIIVLP